MTKHKKVENLVTLSLLTIKNTVASYMGNHSSFEVDTVVNNTVASQERRNGPPIHAHAHGAKKKKKFKFKSFLVF